MPAMMNASGTTGFGWCTWYRSMVSTPSRRALRRPRSTTTGPTGITGNSFVARNTSSRRPAIARPTIRSDTPNP